MMPAKISRARRGRRLKEARFEVLGFFRTLTFPLRHPLMWLFCRYVGIFIWLYLRVDQLRAIRFAQVWPSRVHYVAEFLIANHRDYRLGLPL